jgi:hypothetical protein
MTMIHESLDRITNAAKKMAILSLQLIANPLGTIASEAEAVAEIYAEAGERGLKLLAYAWANWTQVRNRVHNASNLALPETPSATVIADSIDLFLRVADERKWLMTDEERHAENMAKLRTDQAEKARRAADRLTPTPVFTADGKLVAIREGA